MTAQRICRVCNTAFLDPPEDAGRELVCPACRQHVSAAAPDIRPGAGHAIRDALPAGEQLDSESLERAGRFYALGAGIDLHESSEPEVMSAADATSRLRECQAAMPTVPSAYQPSGALPAPALIAMTLGAVVGVVLAALTVTSTGIVAFVAIRILIAIASAVPYLIVRAILGLFVFVVAVLPFMAGGWVAARTTTLFGRWGKNRNTLAAQILSVLPAGLAVAIVGSLFYVFGGDWQDLWGLNPADNPSVGLVYVTAAVFADVVAMSVAGVVAGKRVLAEKFCEDCAQFMSRLKVKSLRRGALLAMSRAVKERNTEAAISLLYCEAGKEGTVELYRCPQCWKGFVEVTAHFVAHWQGEQGKEKKEESWLVASQELPAAEMERFPLYPL